MTLTTGRCVPRRGRSHPRPPTIPASSPAGLASASAIDAAAAAVARSTAATPTGPAPAVDVYGRPWGRPSWLAGEYLALLEAQGRGVGVIYLTHFDHPIGDLSNPRGFASHYTGWTHDLPARLVDHAAGRGSRLMQVVGEAGIGWQLTRIWTGTRTRERSLKRSGGAARRCPVCQLARLGLQPPRPADLLAFEVGTRAAGRHPGRRLHRPAVRALAGGGCMTSVPTRPEGGEPMPASRSWLRTSEAAARLHVTAKTVARWASEGRLEHRRTLGGHRRFDPALIDALVEALTYRL